MQPLTVTVEAARSALGIGRTMLYSLINTGDLQTIRLGKRRMILVSSLHDLIEGRRGSVG